MTMLGAQLGDLIDLKTQLSTTNGEIGDVSTQSVTATTNVVTSVTEAASFALTAINSAMDQLNQAVAASLSKATGTNWTGQNQQNFIGAYEQFQGAMTTAESSTTDTFASFDTAIKSMTAELEAYRTSLTDALLNAQSSVTSMEMAVQGQHDNLDQVMNQGLSIG